jgi:phage tail-like protein
LLVAGEEQDNIWPLPKFYFVVDFGGELSGELVPFQEVSGLATETQVIEYRAGNSPIFSSTKMPGLAKISNVTMKRGIFAAGNAFWNWHNAIKRNSIQRRTVTISLLDQQGQPTFVWTLSNAFPTKLSSTDLKSDGTEIAVDTIELVFESMTISNKG